MTWLEALLIMLLGFAVCALAIGLVDLDRISRTFSQSASEEEGSFDRRASWPLMISLALAVLFVLFILHGAFKRFP
jgi:hypothetical protein